MEKKVSKKREREGGREGENNNSFLTKHSMLVSVEKLIKFRWANVNKTEIEAKNNSERETKGEREKGRNDARICNVKSGIHKFFCFSSSLPLSLSLSLYFSSTHSL